jgi:hypothetical protein
MLSKSVTIAQPTALDTAPKPFDALFRAAVRERMRDSETLRLFLQPVITDRGSRNRRLLEIPRLQDVERLERTGSSRRKAIRPARRCHVFCYAISFFSAHTVSWSNAYNSAVLPFVAAFTGPLSD